MAKETKKEACRPREVNKEEYERGIAQITASQSSTSTGHATPAKHHDALQPVSALGAFPLVRSTQASQLPSLVKGVYKQVALYTGIWATLTVAFLPTLQGLSVVLTGGLLSTFLFHHSMRKLQTYQEEEESARFDARSEAIEKSGLPESVEWLNGMIEGIWPRIPADMFSSVADMLEDTIQANLPSFLTEVKCAELTQGKNPLRVLSSRLLPPTEEDEEAARWNGGVKKHIQLEVAFAYRARGKRRGISKPTKENSRNVESNGDLAETTTQGRQDARILFLFQAKLGPAAMQLPVKVVLNGLVGIAHIRLELTNSSPFLGNVSISFVGLPRVSLDVVPLKLSLAEIPGLSGIIQSSVDSALEMYTLPKKLELNLGEMLVGDGIKRECDACGILLVTIHSARNLERADVLGKGDPYARVNYSRTATANTRVTRVIKDTLNPVWEQTFALVLSPQVLAALNSTGAGQDGEKGESVCVEIYDSDTSSEDDFLGKARWSLKDLIGEDCSGKMTRREDGLFGKREKEKRGGFIDWSIGYFERQPLKVDEDKIEKQENQSNKEEIERKKKEEARLLVEKIPPDFESSLGILAIQIHGISSLRFKDINSEEAFQEAPSSYVEVLLADRRVFKSRTKMDDGEPCFNAMTEQVCDWTTANCVFVIRENRVAGKDAILGVVPIQLHQVFQSSSLVTDVYPLAGGIGSGRLRLSLLFRSLNLPKTAPRLRASVGLLTVHSLQIHSQVEKVIHNLQNTSVQLDTLSSSARISQEYFQSGENSSTTCQWDINRRICLSIYRREAVALILKIQQIRKKSSLRGRRKKTIAFGIIWLDQVEDKKSNQQDCVAKYEIALWDASNSKEKRRAMQRNWSSINERDETKVGLNLLGTIQVGLDFYTGVTRFHKKASQLAGDSAKVFEVWQAIQDAGLADQSKVFDNVPSDPENSEDSDSSSSSSSSSEGGEGSSTTKRLPLQESGSRGQLFNRLARKGDNETSSLKDEFRDSVAHFKNKFRTDNDKTSGVETEV